MFVHDSTTVWLDKDWPRNVCFKLINDTPTCFVEREMRRNCNFLDNYSLLDDKNSHLKILPDLPDITSLWNNVIPLPIFH